MTYLVVVGMLSALATGWVVGLVTYRESRRWCTACGSSLKCVECRGRADRHSICSETHDDIGPPPDQSPASPDTRSVR